MRIFRAIIIGALTGAALFFLPFFFLRGILFFLFIGLIIRFAIGRRFRRGGFGGRGFTPMFADKIRSMNDEEYNQFTQHFYNANGRGYRRNNQPDTVITID